MPVPDLQGIGNVDKAARNALVFQAVLQDGLAVKPGTAVQDGHLPVVQFDERVVHAQAHKGAQDMLHRHHLGPVAGKGGATGSVGDKFRKRLDHRLFGKVCAPEADACVGRCRQQRHVGIGTRMEPLPLEMVRLPDGMLVHSHSAARLKSA